MERRALGAERTSPRYVRKGGEDEGLRQVQVLEGSGSPSVVYGLEWVTVRLTVLYRGGERVRTRERDWCSGPSSCPCLEGR